MAVGETGFLIQGQSGSGKSGLALQMMAMGAELVADDQVALAPAAGQVTASAPQTIAGRIEARHLGLISLPHKADVALHHCIDLAEEPEGRLPQTRFIEFFGIRLPLIAGRNVPNLAASMIVLGKGAHLDGGC